MENLSRRSFLKAAGAAAATLTAACDRTPKTEQHQQQSAAPHTAYNFLNADESSFIEAAVARLIPSDESGPGAAEAGVAAYIDRQLAGAWGAGERLYRSGPWQKGVPTQGYQLPFTPAELFRNALRAVNDDAKKANGGGLSKMTAQDQDAYLASLEKGGKDLGGVPSDVFFQSLLELTIEGFFSDPVYGGNKDVIGWKLVGFPGAYANYYDLVDQHGIAFNRPPMSLGQDARGMVHLHPVSTAPAPAAKGTK
jgi:gluconate 2-dehydrogenase gamma chain